jgi:PAS domain S-box-containing protein
MLVFIGNSQTEAQTDPLVPSAQHVMIWQMPLIVFLTVLSVALSLFLAAYAWPRRNRPGVLAFALLMAATAESSISSTLSMFSRTEETALFWTNLIFLGLSAIPVLLLMFILQYSGRERWLSRRRIGVLFFIPLVTQVVVWTNDRHSLFIRQARFARQGGLMLVQEKQLGPWFGVHLGYMYVLFVVAIICTILMVIRPQHLYRKQAIGMLFAGFPPMLNGVLIHSGLFSAVKTQFSPVSYTLMGAVLAWTLFRHQFLKVVPVARDLLIDSMSDAMLVVDSQHRIVDLNPAAQVLVDPSCSQCIGQTAFDVFPSWHGLMDHLRQDTQIQTEIHLNHPTTQHHYHVRISSLTDKRGQQAGKLIMLRDITERKRTEMELNVYHDHLEELVQERTAELSKTVTEAERLNAQLQQEITERKHAEHQLTLSLQEKNILLKEIHHRVKNNMQVISSLLNLQSRLLQDTHSQQMFQESQHRIKTMALIHEKLYQSEHLTNIDFTDYVRTLAHDLYRSYGISTGNIQLTIDIEHVSFGIDTAIPCGLIINELVSNSLKHAFPGGTGLITIDMKEQPEGVYTLMIGDDGIGIPEDFDITTSDSLGLQLVKGLVEEQLAGELEMHNEQGTTWKIIFQKENS